MGRRLDGRKIEFGSEHGCDGRPNDRKDRVRSARQDRVGRHYLVGRLPVTWGYDSDGFVRIAITQNLRYPLLGGGYQGQTVTPSLRMDETCQIIAISSDSKSRWAHVLTSSEWSRCHHALTWRTASSHRSCSSSPVTPPMG